ncbi:MAG: aminoglycoside phosphotransferase family protein [Pyrinomonadaceae bacterium]
MIVNTLSRDLLERIQQHARAWRLVVEDVFETETSAIASVTRDAQPLVLKVVKQQGDEWHSGKVLEAFAGNGVARVYKQAPGAMLIERLRPGNSLVSLALNGKDEKATNILAAVMQKMSAPEVPVLCATTQDWARGFDRYIASGDIQISRHLVESGQRVYSDLSASQRRVRLLHGDLHHYNVLYDSDRGWLAIDPKGVAGELEYEVGAVLRNPFERPDLFASASTVERRLKQFTSILNLDFERALAWGFAQAVLSAIWEIEDGSQVDSTNPALGLAHVIQPMLEEHGRIQA